MLGGCQLVSESYSPGVSDHVVEALDLNDTELVDQADGENHLELGKFLEAAEDDVNPGRGKQNIQHHSQKSLTI